MEPREGETVELGAFGVEFHPQGQDAQQIKDPLAQFAA